MIILTSFVEAMAGELGTPWSAARWAPSFAREYPVADWARPVYPNGGPIKLRDFGNDPLEPYAEYVIGLYRTRLPAITEWVDEHRDEAIALCCWCPYTKTAKAQLNSFETFHCHLGIVSRVLTGMKAPWKYGPKHEDLMVGA